MINLNRTLSWTQALKASTPDDAATLAMLTDLQGNILKGHGRDHTVNIFLSFSDTAREPIKGLLRDLGHELPSALDQLTGAQIFKHGGIDAGPFMAILRSAHGYETLGLKDSMPEGAAFRAGMKSRQNALADPAIDDWEPAFAGDIDCMILLADHDRAAVQADSKDLLQRIAALGKAVSILDVEEGIAQRNADKQGIEHFGYVDGRSQPLMLQEDIDEEAKTGGINKWNPSIPLSQVLLACPGGGLEVSCGSYFVFRKLEQNVRGFKQGERALAGAVEIESGANPGELAGAYVVGRFENGTPTAISGAEMPFSPPSASNNFNYDSDPSGFKCPYAAHIRKTNPRDPKIRSTDRLMARRGIPFGTRDDDPNDGQIDNKPAGGVGLLFMAYQSSLENQFEFTQQSWANNTGFHFDSPAQPVGIDPVIGRPPAGGAQRFPLHYGIGPLSKPFDFSAFVKMKGGEYFFAPSLSFFKTL